MLTIRLSRVGRRNLPMFRVVLTEHTKPAKAGYIEILGTFNPLNSNFVIKSDRVLDLVSQGAQVSERVAKLMFKETGNNIYKKFYTEKNSHKSVKNPDKYN